MEEKSEFGKGLVICLVKFAEHFMKLSNDSESSAIQMWANGASDHLYEIEVPEGEDWNTIRKEVQKLQDKGLDMGHGAGLMMGKTYSFKDVEELINLTREIAFLIDIKLKLKPELGTW